MKIAQTALYVGDNWWTWSVWLDAPEEELEQVVSVDWILHPSFSDPVRRVEDRSTRFRLDSSGWGTFPIVARVHFRGQPDRQLTHHLQLELPGQEPGPAVVPVEKEAAAGRRRALCVGIDAYHAPHALAGAVHDAQAWQQALEALGFEVATLVDQAATRAAILDGLSEMIDEARAGDVIVFQFAGHGTQTPSPDDETQRSEAFCPADYRDGAFITGEDLARVRVGLSAAVNLTFFVDCSHSGTITRFVLPPPSIGAGGTGLRRPRFIRLTEDLVARHLAFRAAHPADASLPAREELPIPVYFAACSPVQTAFEEGNHGLFSNAAVSVLRENPLVSNAAYVELINARLDTSTPQSASLDCPPAALAEGLLRPRPARTRA